MKTILIIGIGAGDPEQITIQAVNALNRVDVFFLLDKGAAKDPLVAFRQSICERYISHRRYRFVHAPSPELVIGTPDLQATVESLNRDKQAVFESLIASELGDGECGAFLVWGDPTLYDSTLRIVAAIAEKGRTTPALALDYDVIPGISSVQALAARHRVPLNQIGEPVEITTGRKIAQGFPDHADTVVVMLDANGEYQRIDRDDLDIYWGAYIGTPDEVLVSGKLKDVAAEIERLRTTARARNGWVMDSYLMRKRRAPRDE
ncbi:MAG TPA: precorrin-6A synthase (deacetylating) [Pararobbsia sp.]|nr:precorrin-6A synthase (deacetylating) [Pararobbsia sp.]